MHGAKLRNLKVEITPDDVYNLYIKQKKKCALSGWEVYLGRDQKFTASVDRIDSDGDYTIDNIQIVHKIINRLKMANKDEGLYKMAKAIYLHKKKDFQKHELVWEDDIFNDTERPRRIEVD